MKKQDYTYILIFIVLASVGTLFSTHLFDEHRLMVDFYVYYTNLSNYFCLIVMCMILHWLIKANKANQHRLAFAAKYGTFSSSKPNVSLFSGVTRPKDNLKVVGGFGKMPAYLNVMLFLASQLIFITFCVYNFLLADFSIVNYWTNPYNLLFHVILPVMFVGYSLARCRPVGVWWTVAPTLAQLGYVAFIYIRSLIVGKAAGRIVYPYFFLNFATLGVAASLKWMAYMLIISLAATVALWGILKLKQKCVFLHKAKYLTAQASK